MVETLGPRGRRLWDAVSEHVVGERGLVLLEESCRIADRLDRLDALLNGDVDSWAHVQIGRDGASAELVIDSALAEARQQAMALRQLLGSVPVKEYGDGDADSWLDQLPTQILNTKG